MFFREWTEFVTYPLAASRVRSRVERLDTRGAWRVDATGQYPPEALVDDARAVVIPLSMLVGADDAFEGMEVEDFGWIVVWTRQKVWFLVREGARGEVEKLRYVPRHPPSATPPV